jgi:predicted enzyme related to lactoylglutathione lyase
MNLSAVIYVKNLETMSLFYESVLELTRQEPLSNEFCVLIGKKFTLSLVVMPEGIAPNFDAFNRPKRRSGSPIKLSFEVDEVEATLRTIGPLGGVTDELSTAWEWNGFRHLDFTDPEGNVVQIRQKMKP